MIIYPAIDLRSGKVVRLNEGDPERQTIFSDDPVKTAQHWIDEGAEWIHMVNLDGALDDENTHTETLEAVAKLDVKIQFGGGLRSLAAVEKALMMGANRVVIGTIAIQQPQIVGKAVEQFGAEQICVALDAKDGKIATHGWQEVSQETPVNFGKRMAKMGVQHALYTDVKRDGNLQGVNIEETVALGKETGLQVIASGGVSTLHEIETLAQSQFVAGAIIGMALYQNRIALPSAIKAAKDS